MFQMPQTSSGTGPFPVDPGMQPLAGGSSSAVKTRPIVPPKPPIDTLRYSMNNIKGRGDFDDFLSLHSFGALYKAIRNWENIMVYRVFETFENDNYFFEILRF